MSNGWEQQKCNSGMSTLKCFGKYVFLTLCPIDFCLHYILFILGGLPILLQMTRCYVGRYSKEDVSASDVLVSGSTNRDLKLVASVLLEQSSDSESCWLRTETSMLSKAPCMQKGLTGYKHCTVNVNVCLDFATSCTVPANFWGEW